MTTKNNDFDCDLLRAYLEARALNNFLGHMVREKLSPKIKEKNGGVMPDVISDMIDWRDGLRIQVSDFESKNPRHILITPTELRELL